MIETSLQSLLRCEPMPLPPPSALRRSSQNISIRYWKAFLCRPRTLQWARELP